MILSKLELFAELQVLKICLSVFLLPLGLPGGDQVDGLPPAASTGLGSQGLGTTKELLENLGRFSNKKLSFSGISIHFLDFV